MNDIYTNCTTGNEPKTFIFDGVQVEVDDPSHDQTEWVYNHARITHRTPQMIDRVVTAYRQRRLFEEFVLCPEELEDLLKKLVAIDARDQMREWLRDESKWQACDLWEKPTLFGLLDRPDPRTATLIMITPTYAPIVLLERMDDQGYSIVADGQFPSECDSTSYTYKDGNLCFVPEPDSRYILGDGRWLQRPGMRHH